MSASRSRSVEKSTQKGPSNKSPSAKKAPQPSAKPLKRAHETEPQKAPQPHAKSSTASKVGGTPAPKSARKPAAKKGVKRNATAADLMQCNPICCRADDTLNTAAQLLWEHDLGCLVVVDDEHHPLSVLTDRDICFAAYTQGVALWASSVGTAMSRSLTTCKRTSSICDVRELMGKQQLRRLPVVDDEGALVGLIALKDLLEEATGPVNKSYKRASTPADLLSVFGDIFRAPKRLAEAAE